MGERADGAEEEDYGNWASGVQGAGSAGTAPEADGGKTDGGVRGYQVDPDERADCPDHASGKRVECECRFLLGDGLLQLGFADGFIYSDFCGGADGRMDGACS